MGKIIIESDLVEEKSKIISKILDGMRIPELFAVLSYCILNVVDNVNREYDGFGEITSNWLRDLSEKVTQMDDVKEIDINVN